MAWLSHVGPDYPESGAGNESMSELVTGKVILHWENRRSI